MARLLLLLLLLLLLGNVRRDSGDARFPSPHRAHYVPAQHADLSVGVFGSAPDSVHEDSALGSCGSAHDGKSQCVRCHERIDVRVEVDGQRVGLL